MAAREERALAVILSRLQAVAGVTRVELDPPDDHADTDTYPAIAIIPDDVEPLGDEVHPQLRVTVPVTIRAVLMDAATAGNDGLPLSARTAGYALFVPMMKALFPGWDVATYHDRLDGECQRFRYRGHAIKPREDGANSVAVYIDCAIEYPLTLNDPEK